MVLTHCNAVSIRHVRVRVVLVQCFLREAAHDTERLGVLGRERRVGEDLVDVVHHWDYLCKVGAVAGEEECCVLEHLWLKRPAGESA